MYYDRLPPLSHLDAKPDGLFVWLLRRPLELPGALLLAAVVPLLLRFDLASIEALDTRLETTALVALAILLSHLLAGRLSRYPGQDALSSVIPSVSLGFLAVLMLITLWHLPYSRSLLGAGFVVTLAWYALISSLRARVTRPRLALVSLGSGRQLARLPQAHWVKLISPAPVEALAATDGVVVDLEATLPDEWAAFLVACATAGVPVYDSSRTREFMTGEVELTHPGNIGLNSLLPQRGYLLAKGLLDVLLALILLPPTLTLIALAAAAIRIEDGGPVFYLQRRVGYRNRAFTCYKLRSMRVDAAGPSFTSAGDARVTRVGRVIRKYRIDELPQIFNILRGEMSWIGPRPEAEALAEEYARHIPFYAFRHAVKPGITGWAAVRQGNVAEVEAATAKLRHDFFYIKNVSPSLDAFIAAKTVWIILTGFGSR